ncbi:unnamed protein product [Leptidea sinapis]|uniref:Uncharacterized protein n=1 Tax=Leptidea sinapis TaxID=189913 RepID=A0A5E4QZB2_9NEOP|nr:unnamed protein product [Leptidea sinapis]
MTTTQSLVASYAEYLRMPPKACRTPAPNAPIRAAVHTPAQYDFIKPEKPDRLKCQCAVCKKRTITYCKARNVAIPKKIQG